MTENAWQTGTVPHVMLRFLRGRRLGSDRKCRLLAVHCCRRVWSLLTDERSRAAVDVAERFVDALVCAEEYDAARRGAAEAAGAAVRARQQDPDLPEMFVLAARAAAGAGGLPGRTDLDAAAAVLAACSLITRYPASGLDREAERTANCDVIRDLFGNPLIKVSLSPEWQTPTVTALAVQMYESRDFGPMPILADALQDAGCDHPDILAHCRGPGPHVRGCWVVDLVLGKN